MTSEDTPVIGMIVPPAAGRVPPEAAGLFPDGVRFVARGLALPRLTMDGYNTVIDRVTELALDMRDTDGARAISLMGTSLSFFRGRAFNTDLISRLEQATGLPCTTMSASICEALTALGARHIAIGTAYTDEVNGALCTYLTNSGFHIASLSGLGLTEIDNIHAVTPDAVSDLARRAVAQAKAADAVLVSCGGLPALHLADDIEDELGLPVIASSTAGVWGVMRHAGLEAAAPALGRLARAGVAPLSAAS